MIKKLFLVLLVAAPLFGGATGDPKAPRPRTLAIYGGPLWARYSRMPSVATIPEIRGVLASDAGAAIGVSTGISLGGHFLVDAALEAADRGTTIKWYAFDELRNTWVYNFIMIGSWTTIRYKPLPSSSPYLLAGYGISYVGEHDMTDHANPLDPVVTDLNENTWKIDIGVFGGAGFEIGLKKWSPFVEVRYFHGLLDVSKGTGPLESYPVIKTRAFTLLAGVRFKLR
jgi:hypothetical protein